MYIKKFISLIPKFCISLIIGSFLIPPFHLNKNFTVPVAQAKEWYEIDQLKIDDDFIDKDLPAKIDLQNPRAMFAYAVAIPSGTYKDGVSLRWSVYRNVEYDLGFGAKISAVEHLTRFYFASVIWDKSEQKWKYRRLSVDGCSLGGWADSCVEANEGTKGANFEFKVLTDVKKFKKDGFYEFLFELNMASSLARKEIENTFFVIIPADTGGGLSPERVSQSTVVPYELHQNITVRRQMTTLTDMDNRSLISFFGAPNDPICRATHHKELAKLMPDLRDKLLIWMQDIGGLGALVGTEALSGAQKKGEKPKWWQLETLSDILSSWLANNPEKARAFNEIRERLQIKRKQIYDALQQLQSNLAFELFEAQTKELKIEPEEILQTVQNAKSRGELDTFLRDKLGLNPDAPETEKDGCLASFVHNYHRLHLSFKFGDISLKLIDIRHDQAAGNAEDPCGSVLTDTLRWVGCNIIRFINKIAVGIFGWALGLVSDSVGL